jgi:4-amino-4-deoxy-L-arabinose transferase-like glycosyltransferase
MMRIIFNGKALLFVIIFLAAFLRFYALGNIPAGLTNDEVDIGYDAYAISHTGHDQWGQFLPLISFRGFGDYRPPLYTYLVSPLIPIFGLTAFAVRFPSALFGVASVILLYLLLRQLFNNKIGLIGSFLLAISPWSIGLSRIGIESNAAVPLLLAGILCFIKLRKSIIYFYFSLLLFASTLYMYAGYSLLTPLVITMLIIIYRKHAANRQKELAIGITAFMLLCIPLFTQNNGSAKIRFSQINFLQNVNSSGIINVLNDQRGECTRSLPSVICKVAFNKVTAFGSTFIENYISHYSVNFLFISGNENQYSILPQRGLLYIFDFFLLLAGLLWIIKKNKREGYLLLTLLLLSPIPDTITGSGQYSRAFIMLPFLLSIEALGFMQLLSYFDNKKVKKLKATFVFLSIIIASASMVIFFLTYITYFRVFYSRFSAFGYEELMKHVYAIRNDYDKIYITKHLNDTKQYAYYLFYNAYDPSKYQQKQGVVISENKDGWLNVEKIGNIYFVDSLPDIHQNLELLNERVLFISTPVDFPKEVKQKKYIRDLKNDALFEIVPLSEYGAYKK